MPIHSTRMPALFIPHGAGPCFFMEWNPAEAWTRMADFLKGLSATLPQRPSAIVLISAHWQAPAFSVTGVTEPTLIYDYSGFPPHTYTLDYPAPGQPALAQRITDLLTQAQLLAQVDPERGFDHGVFVPLKLVFPDADIPVVQLSLRSDLSAPAHLQAGLALATLRDEGVLVVGSGMSFHNMRGYGDPRFGPISDEFDRWLTSAVEAAPEARWQALSNWAQAPSARLSHPPGAEEHLLPLMVVAGAAHDDAGQRIFSDRVLETTLSAFRFG
ncbi:class III extradiol ring-cleavage dioxygenase [Actimicrobium sp. CCI2.3]|uniref:DODA-type extradiol aromatic ring-opening family dioxygenase n=1 Tax=Actimicrobium sp. CCI2.3 TaxID=3048616 RepID=UPI002AB3FD54|nr:class III extradiol ring-cleavage dioxygenase [Actimicrobium sp. CCI2.3]MDY7575788.1 class III extradiol ring-cleavage dioxygenase [Actimicrobium sp. CCI2.3]MEB0023945.1 class III extradiol ring-cleavage dioxygenase [Actimicrobium sp. CCI2.3]